MAAYFCCQRWQDYWSAIVFIASGYAFHKTAYCADFGTTSYELHFGRHRSGLRRLAMRGIYLDELSVSTELLHFRHPDNLADHSDMSERGRKARGSWWRTSLVNLSVRLQEHEDQVFLVLALVIGALTGLTVV